MCRSWANIKLIAIKVQLFISVVQIITATRVHGHRACPKCILVTCQRTEHVTPQYNLSSALFIHYIYAL